MTEEITHEAFADKNSMMTLEEAKEWVSEMSFLGRRYKDAETGKLMRESLTYSDLDTVIETKLDLNGKGNSIPLIMAGDGTKQQPYLVVASQDLTRANAALARFAKNNSMELPEDKAVYYFHYAMSLNTLPSVNLCFAVAGRRDDKETNFQLYMSKG